MALRGRTAVVTGSTSGIGLAIAEGLSAQGCDVVITGFGDAAAIDDVVARFARQYSIRAHYLPADVTQPAEIRALIAAAAERLGVVDILINNAGIQHVAEIDVFPEEQWDRVIAVNLSAAFHATKAALPLMKQRCWGRIVNIASAHGLVASAGKAAYVAAKHGIIGFTKVTALESARFGITANAVCPGWVRTPLVEQQVQARAMRSGRELQEEESMLLSEKQPLPAFTSPQQIADLVVFLCSESASTMTGASLSMDGGWTAQ